MHAGAYAEIVLLTDRDLRVRAVESAASPYTAGSPRDHTASCAIGARLPDCIDGLDRTETERICRAILDGEPTSPDRSCFRRVVRDERAPGRRWVVVFGPAVGEDGTVEGVVCARLRVDILSEPLPGGIGSDSLYESLVENASDIIFLLDSDARITFVNRRIENYAGLTVDWLIGKHISAVVHPEDLGRVLSQVDEIMRTGDSFRDLSFRALIPNVGARYLVANGRCVNTTESPRLLGVCRDVTESVELNSELLARNNALSALNSIVVAISSAKSLKDGLRAALRRIISLLEAPAGAVFVRGSTGAMNLAVHEGLSGELSADQIGYAAECVCPLCQELTQTVFVSDLASWDFAPESVRTALLSLGLTAGVAIPLRSGDVVTAVLALSLPPPGTLSLEQMEFLNLAAGILGPPVENARLHSDLADRANQLAMLERMARSISAGRDVVSILQTCMREIVELIDYQHAAVVLMAPDGNARLYGFERGGKPLPPRRSQAPIGGLNEMASSREPVILPDAEALEAFHAGRHFNPGAGSRAVAPLIYQGEGVGLLKVWSERPSAFGVRELAILSAAAEHLAIAVCNARLHEAERDQVLELHALAREAQHRIKNNLQMISGLLGMSARGSEGAGGALGRCLRQVQAIAAVHDLLSVENANPTIELLACLRKVAEGAVTATGRSEDIELTVAGEECILAADAATALGVIVNELVTNAVIHGLAGRETGRVNVTVTRVGSRRAVEVVDDGVGLMSDAGAPGTRDPSSGLELAASLAAHGLGGMLEISSSGRGTAARIIF